MVVLILLVLVLVLIFILVILVLLCGCGFLWHVLVIELLIVEDCVENQGIGADGLSPIDGIVAEQQNVPLAEVRIHDYGMLGTRRSPAHQPAAQKHLTKRKAHTENRP